MKRVRQYRRDYILKREKAPGIMKRDGMTAEKHGEAEATEKSSKLPRGIPDSLVVEKLKTESQGKQKALATDGQF
jgi:hypothetical protein